MLQIDQSGKIEQTNMDTVLAMANDVTSSILISARIKREMLSILKSHGKTHDIGCYQLFAAGLFLLLKPQLSSIVKGRTYINIDTEYSGQEGKIKGMLLRFIYLHGYHIPKDRIFFARIGKASGAHKEAWNVRRGRKKANHVVRLQEVLALFEK